MNELQIFKYRNNEVRMIEKDGEPWFVLKDVCAVLDLGSSHKVAERLDEDERNLIPVTDSIGRNQITTIINESGLYSVILRSDKPEAKPFRKWVTSEVLPSIRKTGTYVVNQCQHVPEKTGELARYISVVARYMEKQGSPAFEIVRMIEQVSLQHGINLPGNIVKPNPFQMSLRY